MREVLVRPVTLERSRSLRHTVLRPHESAEQVAAREAPDAFAVGAFDGEELISVGLVAPDGEPGAWRVRGMATVPHARGHGAGSAVLDALLRHAVAGGARRVWCNARTPARSLYERAGFRAVSEEFELPGIGPHVVMERCRTSVECQPPTSTVAGQLRSSLSAHKGVPRRGARGESGATETGA